jgi:hypothetical protein
MAAAPLPLVDPEYSRVSPELALVDAHLAAELRERLAGPADTAPAPAFEPAVVELVEPEAPIDSAEVARSNDDTVGVDSIDDLIVGYAAAEDGSSILPDDVVDVVDEIQPDTREGEAGTTSYPALPAAETRDSDPTDLVLREIRHRLTEEPQTKRRLRRRFVVASGVGAIAAVAVLLVDVHFGIVQLQLALPV